MDLTLSHVDRAGPSVLRALTRSALRAALLIAVAGCVPEEIAQQQVEWTIRNECSMAIKVSLGDPSFEGEWMLTHGANIPVSGSATLVGIRDEGLEVWAAPADGPTVVPFRTPAPVDGGDVVIGGSACAFEAAGVTVVEQPVGP